MRNKEYDRPSWDEFFMMSALLAATRSSCKYLHTGSCVVKDKRIIASGYNGAPQGIKNCLERGCRKDREHVAFNVKGKSVCRGAHAETNAMNQIARKDIVGASIYSLFFPCSNCAKEIVTRGLSEVVYCHLYAEEDSLTKELFEEGEIKLRRLKLNMKKLPETLLQVYSQELHK
jgi:dCMP deaminase